MKYPHSYRWQAGWTLPLTWILLVGIIILMYFFGWKVLLYVLGLFVLITLGVMVRDFIVYRNEPKAISFWFTSDKSLEQIGQLLESAGMIHPHAVEGENVWEWIEIGSPSGEYGVNISRKHKDYNYPVHIKVFCQAKKTPVEMREQLGTQLAGVLKSEIKVGTVNYLSGNDFEFMEEGLFNYKI